MRIFSCDIYLIFYSGVLPQNLCVGVVILLKMVNILLALVRIVVSHVERII